MHDVSLKIKANSNTKSKTNISELQTSSNLDPVELVSNSNDSLEPINRLDRFLLSLLFTLLVDPLRICATLACFTISNAYEDTYKC